MKTSPYVAFYPSDFLLGTMCMTSEEVGAYMRLLCFQWQQGGIPQEEDKLARISGIPAKKLSAVLTKFELHEDGLLKNRRMEAERVKVESFRDKQAERGKKGGRPRRSVESQAQPVENPQVTSELSPTKATENPRLFCGLSQAKSGKSQSETESETKTESSLPLNPPGGRVEESERREGFSADESPTLSQAQTASQAHPPPHDDLDPAHVDVHAHANAPETSLTTRVVSKVEPGPPPQTRTHTPGWHPCAEQIQIGSWFNRRPSTVWSDKEQKVWKALRLEEEDLEILQWFYTESGCRYLRQDLLTLLNNWRGEVDRGRNFNPEENRR